jgi:hypothetical protein
MFDSFRIKVESGKVDGQRLCITGRSAGGYTTLASLAFRDMFKAGASLYGVSFRFLESYYCVCHKYVADICIYSILIAMYVLDLLDCYGYVILALFLCKRP